MNIENNAAAYQMMKKLMIETENRIRSAYNYGFKDGTEQGRAEALSENKRTDKRTETHACDCISRQAAIDALYDKGLSMTAWGELLAMKWSDIQTCIELLPSAQPFTAEQIQTMQELEAAQIEKAYELGKADRPTGHWIENDNGTFSCSNCQSWIPKEQHHYARHCLYCGARMESEE